MSLKINSYCLNSWRYVTVTLYRLVSLGSILQGKFYKRNNSPNRPSVYPNLTYLIIVHTQAARFPKALVSVSIMETKRLKQLMKGIYDGYVE
jgi:hypothetical protein